MQSKLPLFLVIGLSLLFLSMSCTSTGGSTGPQFDATGWDTTDLGDGITYLVRTDSDGTLLQEGYLLNGVKNGMWVEYHPGGDNISTITPFVNGSVTGSVLTLSNRSQMESKKSFGNNTLHGTSATYKYGKVVTKTPYNMGKINGKFQEYNNAKLQREIDYVNGVKDGKIVYYDEEGNVTVEYVYKNDEKVSGGMVEQ